MLTKLLRFPVPDQIKALLEKIDSEGAALDSSSRVRIRELLDEDFLTRYEKFLLKRGLRTYKRAKALDDAMCIVLNQPDEQSKITAAYQKNLAASMLNSSTAVTAGLRGGTVAMWNSTQNTTEYVDAFKYHDPRAFNSNLIK